jgi:hypothetical protein
MADVLKRCTCNHSRTRRAHPSSPQGCLCPPDLFPAGILLPTFFPHSLPRRGSSVPHL